MAGARIELTMDASTAVAGVDFVADKLDRQGMHLLLSDIGEYLLASTRDRAAREVSPDGTRWPALSPRYAKRKAQKHPGQHMLVADDYMLGARLSHQIDGDTLYVGTSAKYGAIQQFGGTIHHKARAGSVYFHQDKRSGEVGRRFVKKSKSNFAQGVKHKAHDVTIPPRPWLGIDHQDEQEIIALTRHHLLAGLDSGTP